MLSAIRHAARPAARLTVARNARITTPARSLPSSVRALTTKRYTQDHEAVVFDDETGLGTVTITDYAQGTLGDVVFLELPTVGTDMAQGDQMGSVESVKAASDIYAPVSGKVEEINEVLSGQPSLINKSAEDKGWLCKIKLSDPSELDKLMSAEEYKAHCEQ